MNIKKIIYSSLLFVLITAAAILYFNYAKLEVVSSYAAKKACSCTFIAERSQTRILMEDLGKSPLNLASISIDRKANSASASVFGLNKKTAQYRSGIGCILIDGKDNHNINTDYVRNPNLFDFATGSKMKGVNFEKLSKVVDSVFDPNREITFKKTRAFLVIHKDSILVEAYAKGYDKDTEMLGWSMTKSITNAIAGMMILDGEIGLGDSNLFPDWKDERKNITLRNLLNMTSGLEWEENYSKVSSATKMLFMAEDIVAVAKSPRLEFTPGNHWEYSSGTTNLICGYLRSKFGTHQEYLQYPQQRIFDKLGMTTAQMEVDEAGNFIGSSYAYATARDWAKFGKLYLQDGVWNEERLLPEGWVDFSRKPISESKGNYGGHFWTNAEHKFLPDAPEDTYSMNGFEGQRVFIIPSEDLIIVRLGLQSIDFNQMIAGVCASIK